mmetsp:Transcript_8922/g.27706  ORF Transcript_8922/g.27706 Transcript_8922/m.27706 type:complete len:207 (+) Transcript_8922:1057-1677(+)
MTCSAHIPPTLACIRVPGPTSAVGSSLAPLSLWRWSDGSCSEMQSRPSPSAPSTTEILASTTSTEAAKKAGGDWPATAALLPPSSSKAAPPSPSNVTELSNVTLAPLFRYVLAERLFEFMIRTLVRWSSHPSPTTTSAPMCVSAAGKTSALPSPSNTNFLRVPGASAISLQLSESSTSSLAIWRSARRIRSPTPIFLRLVSVTPLT